MRLDNLDSRVNQVKCLRNKPGNQGSSSSPGSLVVRSILSLQWGTWGVTTKLTCVRLACFLQARAQTGQVTQQRVQTAQERTVRRADLRRQHNQAIRSRARERQHRRCRTTTHPWHIARTRKVGHNRCRDPKQARQRSRRRRGMALRPVSLKGRTDRLLTKLLLNFLESTHRRCRM